MNTGVGACCKHSRVVSNSYQCSTFQCIFIKLSMERTMTCSNAHQKQNSKLFTSVIPPLRNDSYYRRFEIFLAGKVMQASCRRQVSSLP